MNNILENYSTENIEKLTNTVEKATEETIKITSAIETYKDYKADFTQKLIEAIRIQYPNDDKTREEKIVKKLFNKIISSIIEEDSTDKDNYLEAGYLRKRIEELVMLIYAYEYIGKNDIKNIFQEYNIKLEFNGIENYLNYLNDVGMKNTLKNIIDNSVELKVEIDNTNIKINENIYNEMPVELKYNKNSNPAGITKQLFKKFSLLNLLKKINISKAKDKFDKMLNETQVRNKADKLAVSVADTLVSEENK